MHTSTHHTCHAYLCVDSTFFKLVHITYLIPSGKLCLQDEDLTKKSIPQMARELEYSQAPAIRNNIVVVLSDLAVRYSIKVDPYIPDMAACLKDESLLVRR